MGGADRLDRLVTSASRTAGDGGDSRRHRACEVVLDVLAAACAGRSTWTGGGGAFGDVGGRCSVVGTTRTAAPAAAAYLNAGPTFADQWQEGHRRARGHPGAHVVPAALAVAEDRDAEGGLLLDAVVAGYETGVRLATALHPLRPGVHDTGGWGTVAAAVAAAVVLTDNDETLVRESARLAASVVVVNDGAALVAAATSPHLFVGIASQLGVVSAYAAGEGARARPGVVRHLEEALRAGGESEGWSPADSRSSILDGYVKLAPACAHVLATLGALTAATSGNQPAPDAITDVLVETCSAATAYTATDVSDERAVGFSIPFAVAAQLLRGSFDGSTPAWAVAHRSVTGELARRVRVAAAHDLEARYPNERPARVTVTLSDGRVLRGSVAYPPGDAGGGPWGTQVEDKARVLLSSAYSTEGADAVIAATSGLGQVDGVRRLGAALRGGRASADS